MNKQYLLFWTQLIKLCKKIENEHKKFKKKYFYEDFFQYYINLHFFWYAYLYKLTHPTVQSLMISFNVKVFRKNYAKNILDKVSSSKQFAFQNNWYVFYNPKQHLCAYFEMVTSIWCLIFRFINVFYMIFWFRDINSQKVSIAYIYFVTNNQT